MYARCNGESSGTHFTSSGCNNARNELTSGEGALDGLATPTTVLAAATDARASSWGLKVWMHLVHRGKKECATPRMAGCC
mmetsp:Transcript_7893/g.17422  ORF Transcript_7893/g.17422 Transcript_7893/m.17422 type:complete len:80 (-) Transcript_7893:1157-1396(-)